MILMPEAVTVPSVIMMTSTVSEESFVRDIYTQTYGLIFVHFFFKVRKTEKKKTQTTANM